MKKLKVSEKRKLQKPLRPQHLLIFSNVSLTVPQQDFPLLHSLGVNKSFQINGLIQEIVKLKSNNGVIQYTQKNNHSGYLLQAPSIRCASRYKSEVCNGDNFIAAAVKAITTSTECTKGEAAECLLDALFKKYEESFMTVARNKGVTVPISKKMDAVQVEAMPAECRLGKKASRALFLHLR
jgi:hypothetical protein